MSKRNVPEKVDLTGESEDELQEGDHDGSLLQQQQRYSSLQQCSNDSAIAKYVR